MVTLSVPSLDISNSLWSAIYLLKVPLAVCPENPVDDELEYYANIKDS